MSTIPAPKAFDHGSLTATLWTVSDPSSLRSFLLTTCWGLAVRPHSLCDWLHRSFTPDLFTVMLMDYLTPLCPQFIHALFIWYDIVSSFFHLRFCQKKPKKTILGVILVKILSVSSCSLCIQWKPQRQRWKKNGPNNFREVQNVQKQM